MRFEASFRLFVTRWWNLGHGFATAAGNEKPVWPRRMLPNRPIRGYNREFRV